MSKEKVVEAAERLESLLNLAVTTSEFSKDDPSVTSSQVVIYIKFSSGGTAISLLGKTGAFIEDLRVLLATVER